MGLPNLNLEGFIINGNYDAGQKALLSTVEMQVKQQLMNINFLKAFRMTATAEQIIQMGDAAIGLYRLPERLMYSSGYGLRGWDHETGATKRNQTVRTSTVKLDHFITIKYQLRKFDMNRFLNSGPDVRTTLAAEWASSVTTNSLLNLEAYFLQGVKDYLITRYGAGDKEAILVLDMENIKDEKEADDAFYSIGNKMIDKTTTITMTEIGTSKADWDLILSPKAMLGLTRGYTKLVGTNIAADTLATGQLYQSTILGTTVSEHLFLNKNFPIASNANGTIINEAGINENRNFDLTKIIGIALHKNNFAMPVNFEEFISVIDNDTGEPKFMGRIFFALPESLRPHLGFLIMPSLPTTEEINLAKSHSFNKIVSNANSNQTSKSNGENIENDNYNSYQVAEYDKIVWEYLYSTKKQLSDLIKVTELGKLTNKQEATIKAAIDSKNSGASGNYSLSSITDTSAVATGIGSYEGTVNITFTIN